MSDFQTIYTGIGSAARIPDLDVMRRAEERFYETIAAKDEQKYQRDKLEEREFLEAIKNDPVALISNKATEEQAIAIEDYNNKWGKIRSQRVKYGGLTTQDKVNMQRDKQALMTLQNKWAANQQKFMADKEVMDKDTKGYYDPNVFGEALKNFYDTGDYPESALVPAPQNFVAVLNNAKLNGTPIREKLNGQEVESNMTLDQAKAYVTGAIFDRDAYMRFAIDEFNSPANEEEVKKYLMEYDADKNNIIDPREKATALAEPKNMNNPIIRWAQDHYAPQIRKMNIIEKKKATGGSGGSTKEFLGTDKVPMKLNLNARLGTTVYPEYYLMNTPVKTNQILTGGRVLNGRRGEYPLRNDQSVQGLDFVGVGKRNDGKVDLIYRLPSQDWNNIMEPAGTNVAFPAESNTAAQDYWLEKDGGKKQVKDIMAQSGGGGQTSEARSKLEALKKK